MKNKNDKRLIWLILIVLSVNSILYLFLYYIDYDHKFNINSYNNEEKTKIAVLDSGYSSIEDKRIKIIKLDNAENEIDQLGHGTEVITIISELNPNAEIFSIKILDDAGSGNKGKIYKALKWCLKNKLDIINLSFSMPNDDKGIKEILKEIDKMGTIIVSSYDNENKVSYPANYDFVFGVKAHNRLLRKNEVFLKKGILLAYGGDNEEKTSKFNSYATARVTAFFSKRVKNKELIRRMINE